ncbi:MAG TPA: tetratricopeptide repeat protein [Terriglobales bacterium]|nr:tetratricopeptide repeat protein [Terriglobales bacterium]
MAFGFGFNKQKVLSAAEKFVQQGKLPNAITEYEKVLKADPKDLTVMNTVGDLYSRLGNSEKAVECFKSVGDAYASQGFTVKAIAMYKKLAKLKSSLEGVLRLAELYTQQGLFNDARAQYLQVAEEFLREGQLEQAVRIFQKTLEMDPENVAMRTRLAEVYVRLGKKTEAWQIFAAAAETLRAKGQLGPAEEILQRMITLDPGNGYALLLRGRNAFDAGDMAAAVQCLEKVADLDSHPDGLRTLLQAYLQTGRLSEAGILAAKLLSVHNDIGAILSYADALIAAGQFEDALQVYQQHSDRLLALDSGKILENLHSLIGHVRENTAALEMLLDLLNKAGDNTHLTEVYELLAHGYVQSEELEKARGYYLKLTQLEPENQLHARNYQQVIGRLGTPASSHLITAEEGAVLVDELEATAPFIDQRYPDDVALFVRAALTDAELFISYNMPAKALGPLLSALPQAPRDLRVNQRLAALHTRAGRFTEAAVCCRTLESIYHDAGFPDEATRCGELAAKYEERGSAMPAERSLAAMHGEPKVAVPEALIAETASEATIATGALTETAVAAAAGSNLFFHAPAVLAPASEGPEPAEFEIQSTVAPEKIAPEKEIDLSAEWEDSLSDEPAATSAPQEKAVEVTATGEEESSADPEVIKEAVEEVRFYLSNGMHEEARAAFTKLTRLKPEASLLSALRHEIEAGIAQPPKVEAEAIEEISVADIPSAPKEEALSVPEPKSGALDTFVSDLESSLGEGFLPQTTAPEVAPAPEAEPQAAEYAVAATKHKPGGKLDNFVSDLEASLGDSFLAEAPVVQAEAQSEPRSAEEKKPEPVSAKSETTVPANVPPAQVPAAMAAAATQAGPAPEPASGPSPFTYHPSAVRPLTTQAPGSTPPKFDSGPGVDLADMFGELKHELEEDSAATDEDPETHYNLGVAFREMGLLDEAIGELQKVCQAVDRGHPFPHIMQTYTWLSQCFLDKGIPEAAIRWYERALKLTTIDPETRTALHYELASSYETAGDKAAALNHFMEVYGSNIDYRDVAERIKTLKS